MSKNIFVRKNNEPVRCFADIDEAEEWISKDRKNNNIANVIYDVSANYKDLIDDRKAKMEKLLEKNTEALKKGTEEARKDVLEMFKKEKYELTPEDIVNYFAKVAESHAKIGMKMDTKTREIYFDVVSTILSIMGATFCDMFNE